MRKHRGLPGPGKAADGVTQFWSATERVAETAQTVNIRSVSRVSMTAAGHQPQE